MSGNRSAGVIAGSSASVFTADLKKHVPALDGVRGLAILLVLWHHCYMQPHPGSLWMQALYQANRASWLGVDLFFVLSGFLITGILFDSLHREDYFRRFYRRRALRIFPLYYGVVLLLVVLAMPLHLVWQGREWLLLSYLQNAGFRQPFDFGLGNWFSLNHFWSLAIEEQYYLVWPLVIYLVRGRIKLIWLSAGLAALALAFRVAAASHLNAMYLFTGTPFRMDALLIGSGLALVKRSHWEWLSERLARPVFAVSLLAIIALGSFAGGFDWWKRSIETVGFTLAAVWCAALIGLCVRFDWRKPWAQRVFENRVLRFFGRYSYGLYVWHAFIYAGLRERLSHTAGAFMADLSCIAISIVIALASYHGFEKWFLRMKETAPRPRDVRQHEPELVGAD